ncbi:RSP_2648 family PIN domain-containing protein [Hasllibacter sp. MH4015]|uniref:RSP_2648 family PIN domain-containing protein n=1 Tax=Hasllibacter sp. MH4015 TaxID=2854029 RepID=UPI001CD26277|nr:PIN domain-containing protein [Hasllibacter sp. MH4015]
MIAVLDACVLYPTVMREILLGAAARGVFTPVWSERLLEEWVRAAARNGGAADAQIARAEAAAVGARFPSARIAPGAEAPLWLPDPADIHVLATAIAAQAEVIVTMNLRDFPAGEVSAHSIRAVHPDAFLMEAWLADPVPVEEAVRQTHVEAERLSGERLPLRGLLKRARLPRLGKALGT